MLCCRGNCWLYAALIGMACWPWVVGCCLLSKLHVATDKDHEEAAQPPEMGIGGRVKNADRLKIKDVPGNGSGAIGLVQVQVALHSSRIGR